VRCAQVSLLSAFAGPMAIRMLAAHPVRLTSRISIGMAAHGNWRTTRMAFDMLFASATGDFELVLVDDLSPDDTLDVYREAGQLHGNTRIFSFPENLEYCHSVNAFLSHARGDQLVFLSNDIFVNPTYLRQLLKAAAANPDCGILRGCSNFVDIDSPLHNVPFDGLETQSSLFGFGAEVACRQRAAGLADERYLVGDAFLVSRPVLNRIGTFDTRFVG
jgi:GT2 family glycosyltransferase